MDAGKGANQLANCTFLLFSLVNALKKGGNKENSIINFKREN